MHLRPQNLEQTLERAQDQERLDRDQVNRLRGIDGSDVGEVESLDQIAAENEESWPASEPARLDLQSAVLSLQAEDFQVKYYRETVKLPVNLNLSAGGDLSGDVPGVMAAFYSYNPALTEPNVLDYGVTLGLTVPFDFFLPRWTVPLKTTELQDAQQATDLAETRNGDSQQWEDMTLRFDQSRMRIDDAAQLEAHQKHKAELGMAALVQGHLDIYEVLVFESSYTSACLNRLLWVQQRLTLLAQARLFEAKVGALK